MKQRITAYLEYIDRLLLEEDLDWEEEAKKHLVQIQFFAHERLVHLIVTVLFALGTLMSIMYVNYTQSMIILALTVALLVLLVPYIMHYYLLENSVQKMYSQYDAMLNKKKTSFMLENKE